jgi:uncharacterized protein (DUF2336 family)
MRNDQGAGQAIEQAGGVLMTVDDAIARFRGDWVLMKVTDHDDAHWPTQGYVLAHSADRAAISAALALEPPRSSVAPGAATQPYYVFRAYPRLRSGPEYQAATTRFLSDLLTAATINGQAGARTRS